MADHAYDNQESADLIEDLRARLEEAEETLRAIRSGEVDALVVAGPQGNQIYTLKGAETTYRVLVEAMNEGALVLTPDGTVMYSNSSFADMVDVPLEQVIGSRIHRFVYEHDLAALDELLEVGKRSDSKRELALKNEPKGETVPTQVSVGMLPVDGTEGISAVVTDLTEHKRTETELHQYREHLEELVEERTHQLQVATEELQTTNEELITTNDQLIREIDVRTRVEKALRESEERFRAVFDSTQDAIVIADDEGRYIDANPAVESVFGIPPKLLLGHSICDFMEECYDLETVWTEFLRQGSAKAQLRIVRPDGSVREVEGQSIANIQPGRHLSVLHDITDRVQADQALAAAKDLLEHQVYLLQRALIPAEQPIIEGYSVSSAYIPAYEGEEIGGDFLDVFTTEGGKVGILIGDVSGKGIESAALAASTRSTVRAFAYDSSSPGDALAHANSLLSAHQADEMKFVTSFLAVLDPATGNVVCSSAGHPPAIISHENGDTELLCLCNMPLGVQGGAEYEEGHYTLGPGDKLVLYTDGITEARHDHILFGTDGLENILSMYSRANPDELVEEILDAVKDWAHGRLRDDTAVLVIGRDI